jgi:hypothetical protein
MGRIKDITGEKFSRLFVLRCIGRDKHGNATWLCKCDCGNETVVAGYLLRSGNTKSCGRCPTNLYIKQDNYYAGFLPSGQKFMFDKEDFAIVRRYRWVYDMGYVRMGGCGNQFYSPALRRGCNCVKIQNGVNYTRCWILATVPFRVLQKMKAAEDQNHGGGGVITWLSFP